MDDNNDSCSSSTEGEHDESFSEKEEDDDEGSEEQEEAQNKHSDKDTEGSQSSSTDADGGTSNIPPSGDSMDGMRADSQGAGEEVAFTPRSCLPGTAVPGVARAALEEELACLNICNKVVMHGLQNIVRQVAMVGIK